MLLLISDVIACDIQVVHRSSLVYMGCAKTTTLVVLVAMIVASVVILTRSDTDDDDDVCRSSFIILGDEFVTNSQSNLAINVASMIFKINSHLTIEHMYMI